MYKIGQVILEESSIGSIATTYEAGKTYYFHLSNDYNPNSLRLYNLDVTGALDNTTCQVLKPDYFDKYQFVFTPLINYTILATATGVQFNTAYELTNILPVTSEKIGIQDRPLSLYVINGELFRVGYSGILEIDNEIKILSISKIEDCLDGEFAIVDYLYKED